MLRVIVVDDDETVSKKFERRIDWQELGLVYLGSATNLRDGLRLVEEAEPDILITDIVMPGVQRGDEFIRAVRAKDKDLQIIVITENKYFDFAYNIVQFGLAGLIAKPLSVDTVESAMRTAKSNIENGALRMCVHNIIDPKDVKNNNFIAKVISYMEINYADRITLDELSQKFYVSSCHLCKQFKKFTDRSFVDILNTIRIRHAQELLKDSLLKVYEIAERVGYRDFTYFSSIFKKMVGVSPTQYRNNGDAEAHLLAKGYKV